MEEATRAFGANFGTWSVNEADKTLVLKFELALIPNNNTSEVRSSVALSKDELSLVQVSPTTGAKNEWIYRRAK